MYPFKYPRIWLTIGSLLITMIVMLSLWPESPSPDNRPPLLNVPHVMAYLGLILWYSNIYRRKLHRIRLNALFFLMGICLELLQPISPGRTLALTDIAANGLGLLLGSCLAKAFFGTCLTEIDAWLFHTKQRFNLSQ